MIPVLKIMIPEAFQGNSPRNYYIISPVIVTEWLGQCACRMRPDYDLSQIQNLEIIFNLVERIKLSNCWWTPLVKQKFTPKLLLNKSSAWKWILSNLCFTWVLCLSIFQRYFSRLQTLTYQVMGTEMFLATSQQRVVSYKGILKRKQEQAR